MTCSAMTEALERMLSPIATASVEIGIVVYLTGDGRLAGVRHVPGHREGVALPLRAIVADALATDSRSVVVAHNHPSGSAHPSRDDIAVTRRLAGALAAVEIRLLDHFVVTTDARTSLRQEGVAF